MNIINNDRCYFGFGTHRAWSWEFTHDKPLANVHQWYAWVGWLWFQVRWLVDTPKETR